MRFTLGPIPRSQVLDAEKNGWTALREPASNWFAIQAVFFAAPFLAMAIWHLLAVKTFLRSQPAAVVVLVASFALMVPLHELMHAIVYPQGLRSPHLVIGAWPQRALCYVVYDSPVPRDRILAMLGAPFVLSSMSLLCLAPFTPSGWLDVVLLVAIVHAALCTGDFLTFVRLLRQVPRKAFVHNDGWRTFWMA